MIDQKDLNHLQKMWKLHTSLMGFLPFLRLSQIQNYAQDLLKYSTDIDGVAKSVAIAKIAADNDLDQEHLKKMHDEGYTVQQMMLLVMAPESLPDTTKPKEELLAGWNSSNGFRQKRITKEEVDRSILAGSAILTLAGAAVVLPLAVLGFKNHPDLFGTAKVLSEYTFGLPQNLYDALFEGAMAKKMELGVSAALAFMGVHGVKDLLKKTNDLNLYKKIHPLSPDPKEQDEYKQKIQDIPKNYQHLITHLSGQELCLFLKSDQKDRHTILSKNPPKIEQRYLSVLSSDVSTVKNWWRVVGVAVTPWEIPLPEMLNPLNLKNAVKAMRQKSDGGPEIVKGSSGSSGSSGSTLAI